MRISDWSSDVCSSDLDKVYLLSISFDPADTPLQLARYAQSLHADASLWQFAVMPDSAQRTAVLDAFGIMVVPAPMKQFAHNAAYYLVEPDGRSQRIDWKSQRLNYSNYCATGLPPSHCKKN